MENHLPWQPKFHAGGTGYIDGILASDLFKPVMWGVDQWNRPHVAVKYLCTLFDEKRFFPSNEGAVALFQRYSYEGNVLVEGGHYQASRQFAVGVLYQQFDTIGKYFETLTGFFSGESVVSEMFNQFAVLQLSE